MESGSVELLIVVLGDDEGALGPDCNHYKETQGDDSKSDGTNAGDSEGDYWDVKRNLANSWEEKALKVRLEMLSMADGKFKTNLQLHRDMALLLKVTKTKTKTK